MCQLSFGLEILLKIHVERYKTFLCICNVCNKQFSNTSLLMSHSKMHIVKNDKQCNMCKKVFRSNYKLKEHVNVFETMHRDRLVNCIEKLNIEEVD